MIPSLIEKRHILITCGTGGVGKTTLSAAIALRAAIAGKKALVITMDPAKRLATSLGIRGLGHTPEDLTPLLKAKSPQPVQGTLHALMPDTRKTFEAFVQAMAPNSHTAQRVFQNPIFQIFAKEFSGTNEYMALEKLHQITTSGEYDLIVLDTPPSRNTLAFLEAPLLLSRFFDEKIIRWLIVPTNTIMAAGMKGALGLLEKLTGANFMTHLLEFAQALFEVRSAFLKNLGEITQLLKSEQVGFFLVASPQTENTFEIQHFIQSIQSHEFHFDGIILNRTLGTLANPSSTLDNKELNEALEILKALQSSEKKAIAELRQKLDSVTPDWILLPELARDVHSIEDLYYVAVDLDSHSNASRS